MTQAFNLSQLANFVNTSGQLSLTTGVIGSLPNANGGTGVTTGLTALNANNITTGIVPTARLATGTANSSTYLRGDSTWGTLPNAGKLAQVVQQVYTGHNSQGGTSFTASGLTLAITPSSSSSRILVLMCMTIGGGTDGFIQGLVQRNGTTLVISDPAGSATRSTFSQRAGEIQATYNINWTYLDSPATTSPVTYTVLIRNKPTTGAVWYMNQSETTGDENRSTGVSTLTLMEIFA